MVVVVVVVVGTAVMAMMDSAVVAVRVVPLVPNLMLMVQVVSAFAQSFKIFLGFLKRAKLDFCAVEKTPEGCYLLQPLRTSILLGDVK